MILIVLFTALSLAQAQESAPKSAFESALEQDTGIESQEVWVDIKGNRYRRIDLRGERYYLVPKAIDAEATLYCQPPTGADHEVLVEGSIETYHRSSAFLQAFRASCKAAYGGIQTTIHLGPEMGLKLPENEKSTLKKKKNER